MFCVVGIVNRLNKIYLVQRVDSDLFYQFVNKPKVMKIIIFELALNGS